MEDNNISLKAAEEAAARVNAMLVATGQLRTSDINKNKIKSTNSSSDLFVEKVVINDAPLSARNYLTRSSTQEEISKMSGASVSTRGRYMTQEEAESNKSGDRPLFLHIQGVNEQDVKVAVGRIMHLIMEHTHRKKSSSQPQHNQQVKPRSSKPSLETPSEGRVSNMLPPHSNENVADSSQVFCQKLFREKVFLPMTTNINPVQIRLRLAGEENANLNYIKSETGASVFMRGIGSGFLEPNLGMESQEALHFYLEHSVECKFNEAKDLIVNLAQTILTQVLQEQSPQQSMQFTSCSQPQAIPQPVVQQPFLGHLPIPENVPPPTAINQALQPLSNHQPLSTTVFHSVPPPSINQAATAPPSTVNHPVPTSAVIHSIPPPMVNPSSLPSIDGVQPPQSFHTEAVSHPSTSNLTMQMNSFHTPVIVSTSQQGAHPLNEPTQTPIEAPPTAHLVQISLPSTGHDVISPQIVQTSAAPQLLHFTSTPQIVNSAEGPKVISFAPVSSVASNFVTHSLPAKQAEGSVGVVFTPVSQAAPAVPLPVPQPLIQQVSQPILPSVPPHILPQAQQAFVPVSSETFLQRDAAYSNPPVMHYPLPPQSITVTSNVTSSDSQSVLPSISRDLRSSVPLPPQLLNSQQPMDAAQNSSAYFSRNGISASPASSNSAVVGSEWNYPSKNLDQEKKQGVSKFDRELYKSELDQSTPVGNHPSKEDKRTVVVNPGPLPWAQYTQSSTDSSRNHVQVSVDQCFNGGAFTSAANVASFESDLPSSSSSSFSGGLAPSQGGASVVNTSNSSCYSPKRACSPPSRDLASGAKRYRPVWPKDEYSSNFEFKARDQDDSSNFDTSPVARSESYPPPFPLFRPPPPSPIGRKQPVPAASCDDNWMTGTGSLRLRQYDNSNNNKDSSRYKGQIYNKEDRCVAWQERNQHEGWGAAPGLRENIWKPSGGPRDSRSGGRSYNKQFPPKAKFPNWW